MLPPLCPCLRCGLACLLGCLRARLRACLLACRHTYPLARRLACLRASQTNQPNASQSTSQPRAASQASEHRKVWTSLPMQPQASKRPSQLASPQTGEEAHNRATRRGKCASIGASEQANKRARRPTAGRPTINQRSKRATDGLPNQPNDQPAAWQRTEPASRPASQLASHPSSQPAHQARNPPTRNRITRQASTHRQLHHPPVSQQETETATMPSKPSTNQASQQPICQEAKPATTLPSIQVANRRTKRPAKEAAPTFGRAALPWEQRQC